jgi:hypothetical protein
VCVCVCACGVLIYSHCVYITWKSAGYCHNLCLRVNSVVTVCKCVHAGRNGESRRLGFLGFRTVEGATKALKYFNRTFIDTSKISVEYALPVGASELPRPWSKYSSGSSLHEEHAAAKAVKSNATAAATEIPAVPAVPKSTLEQNVSKMQEDAQLREFLAVKRPRALTKVWANDDEQGLPQSTNVCLILVMRFASASQMHDGHVS